MLPHVRSLDGLRGVAILLVMLLHFGLLDCGWIGVQIFFVLSGFLITRILYSTRGLPPRRFFSGFYANRALRILPLYFFYLALVAIALAPSGDARFSRNWPFLLTFTVNFTRSWHDWAFFPIISHLWSLAVEEQFYLVWPVIVRMLDGVRMRIFAASIIGVIPLFRFFLGRMLDDGTRSAFAVGDTVYWHTLSQVDAFAAGGFVAIASLTGANLRWLSSLFGPLAVLTVLVGIGNGYPLAGTRNLQHVWSYTLLNSTTAAGIAFLIGPSTRSGAGRVLEAFLSSRVLRAIGRVSYGMYVYYLCLILAFWKWLPATVGKLPRAILFLPYLLLVFAVAFVSFELFESFFLKFKRRMERAPSGRPD